MFNKNFYPTPDSVLDMMGFDSRNKIILEPHGGKGNIIDYLKLHKAAEVLTCEIDPDLAKIARAKADRFLCEDFLQLQAVDISHIDMIVMNPPFDHDLKHILHAYEIAPPGCEVYALMNAGNYDSWERDSKNLKYCVNNNGLYEELGDVFSDAERKTNVQVGFVRLYKPGEKAGNLDGFNMDDEPEPEQGAGVMEYNIVKEYVSRYKACLKLYGQMDVLTEQLQAAIGQDLSTGQVIYKWGYQEEAVDKITFGKMLQKHYWKMLFGKMKLSKYVTSGVMKDINAFVERQTKIPFTVYNIYHMFSIIAGTSEQTFNRAIEEAIGHFTKYTKDNQFCVEGWATNAPHMLNEKFIVDYVVKVSYTGKMEIEGYRSQGEYLDDLTKVICAIRGYNYDDFDTLQWWCNNFRHEKSLDFNTWYSWGLFEIKGFKKGTLHVKFQNKDDWAALNQRYAAIHGVVLPSQTWKSATEKAAETRASKKREKPEPVKVNAEEMFTM